MHVGGNHQIQLFHPVFLQSTHHRIGIFCLAGVNEHRLFLGAQQEAVPLPHIQGNHLKQPVHRLCRGLAQIRYRITHFAQGVRYRREVDPSAPQQGCRRHKQTDQRCRQSAFILLSFCHCASPYSDFCSFISYQRSLLMSTCRGLEPSNGPTMPISSISSTRRPARA